MRQLTKITLGLAAMMAMAAVPAFPSTVLNFNFGSGTSNSLTCCSSTESGSFTVTQLQELSYSGVTLIGTTTYNLTPGEFVINFNNATQSLSIATVANETGTPFTNVQSTNVYNATTSLVQQGGNTTSLSETASASGISLNATFLGDLGLAAGATFTLSGGITGSNTTINSDSLSLGTAANVSTPEPASMFMLGSGLLALGAIIRKRRTAKI
jgi:hypothetical protein